MRQTELHGYATLSPVFVVGREVIATQCARKIVTQHLPQYLRSPRAINSEEHSAGYARNPRCEVRPMVMGPFVLFRWAVRHGAVSSTRPLPPHPALQLFSLMLEVGCHARE